MVIASIDVRGGKVVQLKQGAELVLERDDPAGLAAGFDMFGEVAVIDLDAAQGTGGNLDLIKPLLRKAECRVGGGVRTPEQALRLISMGATKVIVGSQAFRRPGGPFGINAPFLEALARKVGKERLVIAVDSRDGVIVADGWKTATGLPLLETAAKLEAYAGELLWTCVEREGMMGGIDMEAVRALRGAVSGRLTVAGGVSTTAEVEAISAVGCDIQLGMALYTGAVQLADAFIAGLNWNKSGGMVPLIAQSADGQVLMAGFADKEAMAETFKRGNLCFHSRTRDALWMKGERSGNTMRVLRLRADCDRDAVLAVVVPSGPVCHTGAWSCFETGRRFTPHYLHEVINQRLATAPPASYTAGLTAERVRRKVMEEAYEVCTARTRSEVVWEAADLLYHALVLLAKEGVGVDEVLDELDRRHKE